MRYEEWMNTALRRIDKKLKIGTEFELKSLFTDYEWNDLSKGERINFGKYFSNQVKEGEIPQVVYSGQGRGRSNLYKKIGDVGK